MMIDIFLFQLLRNPDFKSMMFWITAVIYCLLLAGCLAGKWRLLEKAGRVPWHCLVPFLGNWDLYDICWDGRFGIIVSALYLTIELTVPATGMIPLFSIKSLVLFLAFIGAFVLSSTMKIKLTRSFGKGGITAYGLIFLEGVFYLAGFRNCTYYGRTLRRYNPKQPQTEKPQTRPGLSRTYMISLYRFRSSIALAACICTFALCMFAVAGGLIESPSELTPERGGNLFKLFTVNSNFFSAIGAAFMIPFAVEGIRKKRFTYPKWVQMIQYSGAICTTLTIIFAIFLILPTKGIGLAFGKMNFWLHLVCPVFTLILLFSVETDLELSLKESLLCLTPFYIYACIYLFNVVLLGEANGGWRDIYKLATYMPPALSAPLMFILGFFVAQSIRVVYNRLARTRQERMRSLWGDDLSSIEIKIEVYGLGRYTGMHDEITNISVPIDIFQQFAERYDVTVEDLARAFTKGVTDGLKERSEYYGRLRKQLDLLPGTPERFRKDIGG
ncbi:MAG: DUF5684 domain-containing protein [Solobacterium sp.]|nr:DUF5684 domain-containing protein [Solobacterium sp.]